MIGDELLDPIERFIGSGLRRWRVDLLPGPAAAQFPRLPRRWVAGERIRSEKERGDKNKLHQRLGHGGDCNDSGGGGQCGGNDE